jgi:ribonuclease III
MEVKVLEERLGYKFSKPDLLTQALTHRSFSNHHNERLEFLGDSVLNLAVAHLLYDRFSKVDEGDLSRLRSNLVKQQALFEIAQSLSLAQYLKLGEGELKSGGFRRPSILADAMEGIFGAILLDSGFDAAAKVIRSLYVPMLTHIDPKTLGKDAKTLLQEYLQGRRIALPTYNVVATHGAAHSQEFEVECLVPKLDIRVIGAGGSRRAAEQSAAQQALDALNKLASSVAKRPRKTSRQAAQLTLPVAIEQSPDAKPGTA